MNMKKWFNTFWEEKKIEGMIQIEHKGILHVIESEFLKNVIIKAHPEEQKQIKEILIKIDFKNGDVMKFLEYLARGYIYENY